MANDRPRRGEADGGLSRRSTGGNQAGAKADELMPQVYDELRRLAANYLRHERPGQTLQATALVHEAFLRLSKEKSQPWKNRTHFLAIAALSMRQILVQRARARNADKRGGGAEKIALDESVMSRRSPEGDGGRTGGIDVLELDTALEKLAALDPQQAKIVELRYFGGMTVEEVADAMEISPATVKRHWTIARAWLHKELSEPVSPKRAKRAKADV
jgi:RNA polymerase sigma factor (TIGR02999 family)